MRHIHFSKMRKIGSVDDLVEYAQFHAETALRMVGHVHPTLYAVAPRGLIVHQPERIETEADKDYFALESRLVLVAARAFMCAMVLEAWVARPVGGQLPSKPSQASNREEVLTVFAESRPDRRFAMFPIKRNLSGEFEKLEEDAATPDITVDGRFVHLLPPTPLRESEVRAAQVCLESMGIRIGAGGFSPN